MTFALASDKGMNKISSSYSVPRLRCRPPTSNVKNLAICYSRPTTVTHFYNKFYFPTMLKSSDKGLDSLY